MARDFDRAWPNRMITLRYETLIRDPHKEIARAVRFLGAGHDVNQIAACVAHGAFKNGPVDAPLAKPTRIPFFARV